MTLTVKLDDEQTRRLEETARRLNVTASELARAAINDLLSKQNDDFESAVQRVLEKNAELYQRLALRDLSNPAI